LLILGIETSREENILCLGEEEKIISQQILPSLSSREIYPLLNTLLKQKKRKIQEIKGIVVSLGPGSFTGLRVGISVAKALAFSLNIPVVGIPTPDSWAFSFNLTEGVLCVLYGAYKKDTYYGSFYEKNGDGSIFPHKSLAKTMKIEPSPFLLSLEEIIQRARKLSSQKIHFMVIKEEKIVRKIKEANPNFSTLCKKNFPLKSFLHLGVERIRGGKLDNVFTLTPIYIFIELDKKDFAFWWVIEYQKLVVGYAGYWKIKDEAHIVNFAIHPDFRRKKLGTKLLVFLISHIQNQGLSVISLEVRESNIIAQHLYEKFGFRKIAIRPYYYIYENAIVYWKRLPD